MSLMRTKLPLAKGLLHLKFTDFLTSDAKGGKYHFADISI